MALSSLKEVQSQKETEDNDMLASGSDSDTDEESAASDEGNAGWADSIAKVLNTTKPKTNKTLVLSRAKKIKPNDKEKSNNASCSFEIEGKGEIKDEKPSKELLDEKIKSRKNIQLDLRVKTSWKDAARERALRKIAQRGVVQLFNAVRIQQKELQQELKEAGPLDSRRDAVLNNISKRKFLDVLMGGKRSKSEAVDNTVKNEMKEDDVSSDDGASENEENNKKKSEWSVLRDDFMTNKKIKHWDEEDNDEDNMDQIDNDDSDTDNEE